MGAGTGPSNGGVTELESEIIGLIPRASLSNQPPRRHPLAYVSTQANPRILAARELTTRCARDTEAQEEKPMREGQIEEENEPQRGKERKDNLRENKNIHEGFLIIIRLCFLCLFAVHSLPPSILGVPLCVSVPLAQRVVSFLSSDLERLWHRFGSAGLRHCGLRGHPRGAGGVRGQPRRSRESALRVRQAR